MREAAELISDVFASDLARSSGRASPNSIWRLKSNTAIKRRGASGPSFETIVASGPAFRMGARAADLQTVEEKRIGRPRPGCYTPRLLQRHDPHGFPGQGSQDGPKALQAVLEASKRPRRRSGPVSRLETWIAARRGVLRQARPGPLFYPQHGTWPGTRSSRNAPAGQGREDGSAGRHGTDGRAGRIHRRVWGHPYRGRCGGDRHAALRILTTAPRDFLEL